MQNLSWNRHSGLLTSYLGLGLNTMLWAHGATLSITEGDYLLDFLRTITTWAMVESPGTYQASVFIFWIIKHNTSCPSFLLKSPGLEPSVYLFSLGWHSVQAQVILCDCLSLPSLLLLTMTVTMFTSQLLSSANYAIIYAQIRFT